MHRGICRNACTAGSVATHACGPKLNIDHRTVVVAVGDEDLIAEQGHTTGELNRASPSFVTPSANELYFPTNVTN